MGGQSPEMKNMLDHYEKGLALYRGMKWDDAGNEFKRALDEFPEDGPSRLYLLRCLEYKENPPPADWDGVYTAKTK